MRRQPIPSWSIVLVLIAAAWVLAGGRPQAAKIEIKVDYDKAFSFASLHTWNWHPDGAGEVKVAYSSDTDPEPIHNRMRPTILAAVEREMTGRRFEKATAPDLFLHYYLLVTVKGWSQQMGQFAPSVPAWGLPPFTPQTTALEYIPVGTFLLDVLSAPKNEVVWRGAAQADIDLDHSSEQRAKALDRAITDLMKKFPPKK